MSVPAPKPRIFARGGIIAMAIGLTLSACGLLGGGEVGANPWTLASTSPDETELLVATRYGGVASGCSRFENWEVTESPDRVEIIANLWQKTNPRSCTSDGAESTVVVRLSEPLGTRELVGCVVGDCRSPVGQVGSLIGPPVVAATESNVAVAGRSGMSIFDVQGNLRSVDSTSSLRSPVSVDGLIVSDGGASLTALDPTSGTLRWTTPGLLRAVEDGHVYACTESEEEPSVAQVEAATGDVRWRIDTPCDFVTPMEDSVIVIGRDTRVDGGSELVVVDRQTGAQLKREAFDDGTSDKVNGIRGLIRVDGNAVAFGWQADTVVLDAAGTEIARRADRLGTPVGSSNGVLITALEQRLLGTDPYTGEIIWERDRRHAGGQHRSFIVNSDTLWLPDAGGVTRIDATTGMTIWSTPVARGAGKSLAVSNEAVYVTSALSLTALDRDTGAELWSVALAWSGDVITATPAIAAE